MKPLYLYGPPASGKSTWAKRLHEETGLEAVDLDAEIVRRDGRAIPEIFATDGEKFFRDLESETLKSVEAPIVALGGGVTGDIAGLSAAMYLRGIKVVQVPTSLLAMVDSSVGGKVAIDLEAGKNLAGAFWQPRAVVADVTCLHSLSLELLTDSCGEVIKHAVLADDALLEELCARPLNGGDAAELDDAHLVDVVARNVSIKRDVVNADEREHGMRQTLNLGHTIGHGIEAASDFALGHGSCVAAGLCCMLRSCVALGWTDPALAQRVERCVEAHGLPTDTQVDHQTLMSYMTHDKKRHGDSMNVVVARGAEDVVVRRVSLDELARIVELGCGIKE